MYCFLYKQHEYKTSVGATIRTIYYGWLASDGYVLGYTKNSAGKKIYIRVVVIEGGVVGEYL